jgi:hypothetical protein
MEFDDTNRGTLFPESAPASERHPDYTGKINVNGQEYRLAAWKKTGKSGVPFLSLSVSEFKQQSGYDAFKQQGQRLQSKKDEPLEDIADDTQNMLDRIPF